MSPNKGIALAVLCAATVWATAPPPSVASEDGHGHEHGTASHGTAPEEGAAPESVAGVWTAIDTEVARLDATIAAGSLADVHEIAFRIRDLAGALPAKSEDLPEAKRKLLKGLVERVAEHARNLDTYGDAGKSAETAEEFAQLKKRLDYMRRLYPSPRPQPTAEVHEHD